MIVGNFEHGMEKEFAFHLATKPSCQAWKRDYSAVLRTGIGYGRNRLGAYAQGKRAERPKERVGTALNGFEVGRVGVEAYGQ